MNMAIARTVKNKMKKTEIGEIEKNMEIETTKKKCKIEDSRTKNKKVKKEKIKEPCLRLLPV